MSDDSKKGHPGALAGKPSSDDRKSSPASSGKRIVIKSADMNDDMQKEAVDTAIAVRTFSLFLGLLYVILWCFRSLHFERGERQMLLVIGSLWSQFSA